jgi:hypothetical protein
VTSAHIKDKAHYESALSDVRDQARVRGVEAPCPFSVSPCTHLEALRQLYNVQVSGVVQEPQGTGNGQLHTICHHPPTPSPQPHTCRGRGKGTCT